MYEYLDRFIADWKDDDLVSVLSKLPERSEHLNTWSAIIAAVGVDGFMKLSMTLPNKQISIPSLYEILTVFASECINEKCKTMSLSEAKQTVLGNLTLKEVDAYVDRLQTVTNTDTDVVDTEPKLPT
jgi:hypothetical protein